MTDQLSISFQADGSPYSEQFDDIYFDTESGYQQSEQVFIRGNQLAEQLIAYNGDQPFTIGETGFGTGLNFLLTLKLLDNLLLENRGSDVPDIHFISTEKFPMSKEQLTQSLSSLPTLSKYSQLLVDCYPDELGEKISLSFFNNKVTLSIYFDDSTEALSKLTLKRKQKGLVNAWYLDGFSPAKNPDMWHKPLFEQIARLSKPQATLSTFTVAGFIRRQLIEVGFRVRKTSSKGKKKEILTAKFQSPLQSGKGFQLRRVNSKPQHVSIIGGGIASACAAYSLTKRGIKVTLYCKDEAVAQGASSNAIGALYPLLHQQRDDISLFYEKSFWHAKSYYDEIDKQGFNFSHNWCGLLEISYKHALEERQQQFEDKTPWPKDLIHSIDAKQASKLSNIELKHGGLFMPNAGWVAPQELVNQIIKCSDATGYLKVKCGVEVAEVQEVKSAKKSSSWKLMTNKGEFNASTLVLCGGAESIKLSILDGLQLSSVRGQVSSMKTNDSIKELSTVICHKGYLTPESNGIHCIGATFDKNSFDIESKQEDDKFNLKMLNKCLPDLVNWTIKDVTNSKARLRCMTPDHLPMVGAVPDIESHKSSYPHLSKDKNWRYDEIAPVVNNLFVMTGFGARGLCSAPLCADILADDICGTPYPVDETMLFNLAPNRFVIRDIIRRKFD